MLIVAALQYQALCVVVMQEALALRLPGQDCVHALLGNPVNLLDLNRAASSSAFTITRYSRCEVLLNPYPVEQDITFGVIISLHARVTGPQDLAELARGKPARTTLGVRWAFLEAHSPSRTYPVM